MSRVSGSTESMREREREAHGKYRREDYEAARYYSFLCLCTPPMYTVLKMVKQAMLLLPLLAIFSLQCVPYHSQLSVAAVAVVDAVSSSRRVSSACFAAAPEELDEQHHDDRLTPGPSGT